jgi:hypothetical protein
MTDASPPRDYERSDAEPRVVGWLAGGTALFLFVTPFMLSAIYPDAHRRGDISGHLPLPPAPRLQVHPAGDLTKLHAAENAQLEGAGWVDRRSGTVRIPIDRAMALVVQRGLPDWPSSSAPTQNAPQR